METMDTLYRIIQTDSDMYVMHHTVFWDYISVGDIVTVLGLLLTYCLFKRQLTETRKENIKGIKAQWFLEVVIEPHLETIKKFYDDSVSNVKQSMTILKSSFSKKTAQDFSTLLAKEKRKYKNDLKDDLGHIRSLIKATKPELSKDFDAKLDDLVDVITALLDQHQSYEDSSKEVKNKLLENQQELLAILYKTIGDLQSDIPSKKCKTLGKQTKK